MAGEWRDLHWGDLAALEYGRGLRGYGNARGSYRVYGTNGPIGWHGEPLCNHATVIVGRKGAYRGVHYSPHPCYIIDTAFYLEPQVNFDIRWAYYELLTHDINSMDTGSAIPSTNRDSFYHLEVKVPPLDEQRAIGHILGTLDDRIDLNRQMNETLEAIAQAIFKSWFVGFDPVRAKMDGRWKKGESTPGLPAELWDLFPDSFEDSEIGEIPAGWAVKRIEEVAERVAMGPFGSSIKVETFVPEGVPIISGQHLNGFVMEDNTFNFITQEHAMRLANRFRDSKDPLKMVMVRDMWLTGFDAPSLHTMYVDKPMRGHGLMQAIARVNRVFHDKPGGLVVDYLGLAHELKQALATYTESGGTGKTAIDQEEAVALMLEKYEICCDLFHGFDWSKWVSGSPEERVSVLPPAQEHILAQVEGKERFLRAVQELSQAFALAVPHEEALHIRNDVGFFQAVRAVLSKRAPSEMRPEEELDHAIRQIVSRAVAPEGVVDIFSAAGLKRPDISILSDEFLAEVRSMPQRNLAVELLRKLLSGEIRSRGRKNVVQARSFAEMLEQAIRRYQNRAIEATQVIEELIALAKEMRQADTRSEALNLSEEELAFYDALETNDSAVKVLGDNILRTIARELVAMVRKNVTIDWTMRENVRAQLRVIVKRILRKYGYPPDKQEKATQTVLEQAEVLSQEWVNA